jgi:hypothetical protein
VPLDTLTTGTLCWYKLQHDRVAASQTVGPETTFIEIAIWRIPRPMRGSRHGYKYRLALVSSGICVLRYDNEAGKGDHKHLGDREVRYDFTDLKSLQAEFWRDVETWRRKHEDSDP